MNLPEKLPLFYCTKKKNCDWQGIVLTQGLAWGKIPTDTGKNSWRAWHDSHCKGDLIQVELHDYQQALDRIKELEAKVEHEHMKAMAWQDSAEWAKLDMEKLEQRLAKAVGLTRDEAKLILAFIPSLYTPVRAKLIARLEVAE